MSVQSPNLNSQLLSKLVPISDLTNENLQDLIKKTKVETLPPGRALFKKGDTDNFTFYLLSGQLTLLDADNNQTLLAAGTHKARFPLDHHRPRKSTALAKTEVHFIRIDNDLLDILLTWDQNAGYMVTEIDNEAEQEDDDNDWMTNMLRSEIFHRIPPGNIQAVFMQMEPVHYNKGDMVIRQGEDGDYYYHIKKGRCLVTHSTKSGKEIKLAELETGQGFGEEALITDSKRNANITMLTDGVMMRLAKDAFQNLLKEPVLQLISKVEADAMVADGAQWLDVRLESEYKNDSIPGSINIPLFLLRYRSNTLDKSITYIVYCDTGRRSSSAAYLLNERGFSAYVLEGGLRSIDSQKAS